MSFSFGTGRFDLTATRAVRKRTHTPLMLELLEGREVPAAIPTATLTAVPEALLGEDLTFSVSFDNTSPVDTGYGPYVDLYLPATGIDGAGAAADDGISFVSATYLGRPITATAITLTAAGVQHPYAVNSSGQPLVITPPAGFQAGDQLVVLLLPYGSYTPEQPAADIAVTASISNLADANAPLPIRAQGGFRFGNDPLDNPSSDPSIVGPAASTTVTPTVFMLTKRYVGPEDETASGPNFPREYRIDVDVANGQSLTDLDLTDILSDQVQFLAVTATSGSTTAIATPSLTVPGGILTRRFASVTGTASDVDASMTFRFYVPRVDAGGTAILNPTTGNPTSAIDDASTRGTWDPIDGRDPPTTIVSDSTANDHTLTIKSVAVQKDAAVVNDTGAPGASPGDTIEYTIDFQISDYFAFQNFLVNDLFSDGQGFDASFTPTLLVNDGHGAGGATSGGFLPANFTLTPDVSGGSDRIVFRVSDELLARGFTTNGMLVGGAIPAGGTGGPPPQSGPPLPFGPTAGRVVFRTVVQDQFTSPPGPVNQGDILSDAVTAGGDLLSNANLTTPTGESQTDDSAAQVQVNIGGFDKTIYAINGDTSLSPTPGVSPGDVVTFRLRYTLPITTFGGLTISDYLPLPVFLATEITAFNAISSGASPAAGSAQYGPNSTFFTQTGVVPSMSTSALDNRVTFTFNSFNDSLNRGTEIDILFSVTVTNRPYADRLLLTNFARSIETSTDGETTINSDLDQVVLQEPALDITKGIVATTSPTGVFSPTIVGPVPFNAPGTIGSRFTGTITSAGLAATPIDSNLSGVDQGDTATFAIVIENTGSSVRGAFDLLIRDTLPAGVIPTGVGAEGINLRVTDGAGNPVSYLTVGGGFFDPLGGIQLVDPSAALGAIGPGFVNGATVQNGTNIIIVTFDLITAGTTSNQTITDTATLANYASQEGGPDFTAQDLTDTATIRTTSPLLTKTMIGSEIVNAINSNTEAVVGELVTYRVRITVPEGMTPGARLVDTLDPELAFVSMVSSSLPPGVTLQGGSLVPTVTNTGRTLTWDLGSIVNSDTNNTVPEVIELVYQVVVVNTAATNADDRVNNSARLTFTGQASAVTVSAANVTVLEPQVRIDKSVVVNGAGTTGDANDPFVYTIVLSNPPGTNAFTADAFDVTFHDLFQAGLPGSPLQNLSFIVTDTAGIVTAANFELVTDPITNRLVLQTAAGGDFDLLVDPTRTITIRVDGEISQTVTPGEVIPNTAEVQWTSLPGDPGVRSAFNPNSTERTGADGIGGVNDYVAVDGVDIIIDSLVLTKTILSTSETATVDAAAVVVGEIVRYRVKVQIPDFGTPTSIQFADLLPTGMQLVGDSSGRIAFVTGPGDNLVSSSLFDPDPMNPPQLYLNGNETTVDSLTPEFPFPSNLLSFSTVNGRTQVTFDLGFVTNPATPGVNDSEFVIAEFNVLVTNVVGNQAGTIYINELTAIQSGSPVETIQSAPLRLAEPAITNLTKNAIQAPGSDDNFLPDTSAHDAGDVVHYGVRYSNGTGSNVSTAYDVRIVDALPISKMQFVPGSVRVYRNGSEITGGFTNNSSGNTLDITIDVVAPGDRIAVAYDAVLTTGVVAGETVPNTVDLTYTSLPGTNGTNPNPTGSMTPGTAGSDTGERTGADGVGGTLNDYAGTASAAVPILTPTLDKSIQSTDFAGTGSDQFDPTLVDLTPGERVTYRLVITVPEGTTTLRLSDLLPTLNAGTISYVSSQVVSIGANLSGSSLAVGDAGTLSGSTVTFNFGTVVNSPDNVISSADQIVVDIVGQLIDVPENVAGITVTNVGTLDYGSGTISDTAIAEIVEPALGIQKSVAPGSGDAGVVFTYTVTVNHLSTSTAPAVNVLITDLLNSGNLELLAGSVTVSLPTFLVLNGNGAGDTTITVGGPILALGSTLTITYQARLTPTALPGATIPNTAALDYVSVPVGGRDYDDDDDAVITVNSNSLGGLIYRDLNNNGIYEPGAGETLVAGQSIQIRLTGTDLAGNPVDTTLSTSSGSYSFTGLRPGSYTVTQLTQPTGVLDGRDTPGTPFGGTGTAATDVRNPRDAEAITSIVIPTGGNIDGVSYNFGELLPASIGDFVWNDLNGNGRQDVGEPGLGGVAVSLIGIDDTGRAVNQSTTTTAAGIYAFSDLRPGDYRVSFTAPGGFAFTAQNSPVASPTTNSDADPTTGQTPTFALPPGASDTTRDAGLYLLTSLGDFVWYDINQDGVQDAGEPGIPGVSMILDYAGLDGVFATGDDAMGIATTTTNLAGYYLFANRQPGTYRVRVDASTLPNGIVSQTYDLDGLGTPNQADVAITSGQNNLDIDFGYTVPVSRNSHLGDLVWYDVNRDGLPVGEPGIASVSVTATWFGFDGIEGSSDDLVFTDVTTASGIYGFTEIPYGDYRVSVDSATLPPGLVPTYDLDSGLTNPDGTTRVTLTVLQPVELGADFGYTGQAAFGDRVWLDFNGDGVQDSGEPGLAGVTMTATWAGPDNNLSTTADNVILTTPTGVNGIYNFTDLPGGLWRVAVTAGLPGGVTNTGDPDGTLDGQTTFALAIDDALVDKDFGYQGTNALAGYVYRDFTIDGIRQPANPNPETGIVGVTITLTAVDTAGNTFTRTAITAADGSYSFPGLPAGDYQIVETQPPSVFAAGVNGFYDGLDTPGMLNGVPAGSSPAKNQLAVTLDDGQSGEEFNFGENPPADPFGYVYIDLNQNGSRDAGEPGIPNVEITISGVAFPGTALERPLTPADIPGGAMTVLTDASGFYNFPILPPGTYSIVQTQPPGFLDGQEEDADPNGPPATVLNDRFDDVQLFPFNVRGPFNFGEIASQGRINGSVYVDRNNNGRRDPGEVGIGGVIVRLDGIDLAGRSARARIVTAANGTFSFRGMTPGTYRIIETHPQEYIDGRDRAGSAGGTVSNDIISNIVLGPNVAATGYQFGERGLRSGMITKRGFITPGGVVIPPRFPGSGIANVNYSAQPRFFKSPKLPPGDSQMKLFLPPEVEAPSGVNVLMGLNPRIPRI